MKVFISWSGDLSKNLSVVLKNFLESTFEKRLKIWLSHEDIKPSEQWLDVLNKELTGQNVGIICLTPENFDSSWLLFEAGALAKVTSDSKIFPYCLNVTARDIPEPLKQFQVSNADDKTDTLKLLHVLNSGSLISDTLLRDNFDHYWPVLSAEINAYKSPIPYDLNISPWDILTERERVRIFSLSAKGAWWEYISENGIGYFEILFDKLNNSVALVGGQFYNTNEKIFTSWQSVVACVEKNNTIQYLRKCSKTKQEQIIDVLGYGCLNFERTDKSFTRGAGNFYDINQDDISKKRVLNVQIRRIDEETAAEYKAGNMDKRKLLLLQALNEEFGSS